MNQIEKIKSTPETAFFNSKDLVALNLSPEAINQWIFDGGPLSVKIPKGIIKKEIN